MVRVDSAERLFYVAAMRVFDVDLEPAIARAIAAHGERDYPIEACGLVLGRPGEAALARVVPMKNVQDRYHERDPQAFPRNGRDAFRIDELERMRTLEAAEEEGLTERILYHSHCDAGAYFSPEDRAMAVQQGLELMPGVVHVVVSVRRGCGADMAAYRYDPGRACFEEVRIPLGETQMTLPDLEVRAMEGREAARPIRPCGGMLAPRRVTAAEREHLARLTDRVQVRVDDPETVRDIRRLELGLLSPLTGFLRAVEVRAIEQSGRLLSGTPWRAPVVLEIPARRSAPLPAAGALIELIDPEGLPIAAMGLTEVARTAKDATRLAGPVFVYPSEGLRDAAEVRAEILRKGMRKVLAIGPSVLPPAMPPDLSEFDGILTAGWRPASLPCLDLTLAGRDPWLDAVMAQNQGATHVWTEDAALARTIADSLSIAPWRPPRVGAEVEPQPLRERDMRLLRSEDE